MYRVFFSVALCALFIPVVAAADGKLADNRFAAAVCQAWNASEMPCRLGSEEKHTCKGKQIEGSDWIHSLGRRDGKQKIVSGRADCRGWAKVEWNIGKDETGKAMCVSAGYHNGKGRTWQFIPSTANWFEFARSFGMGAFYSLWRNGMVGSKGTAWSNRAHFALFFALAGRVALKTDWRGGCVGLEVDDATEALAELKKAWKVK